MSGKYGKGIFIVAIAGLLNASTASDETVALLRKQPLRQVITLAYYCGKAKMSPEEPVCLRIAEVADEYGRSVDGKR